MNGGPDTARCGGLSSAASLVIVAAPFALAALAMPADLRWACLPFVAGGTVAASPCLPSEGRAGLVVAAAASALLATVATGADPSHPCGLAALCLCVSTWGHLAWRAARAVVFARSRLS